jgi:WD40 repeat protein
MLEETVMPISDFTGVFWLQPGTTKLVLRARAPGDDLGIYVIWNYRERAPAFAVRPPQRPCAYSPAVLSDDAQLLGISSTSNSVNIVDVQTNGLLRSFEGHAQSVFAVLFHPDGRRLISAGRDGVAAVWNLRAPAAEQGLMGSFEGHNDEEGYVPLSCLALSPDGRHALTGDLDGHAILWNVDTFEVIHRFPRSLSRHFKPEPPKGTIIGAMVTGADSSPIAVRSRGLKERGVEISSAEFVPDGSKVAVAEAEDSRVNIFDVQSGALLARHEGPEGESRAAIDLAVSPDGRYIAVAGNPCPFLWNWQGNRVEAELVGHRRADPNRRDPPVEMPLGGCVSISFTGDGSRIITGGDDGTIRFWSLNRVR